MSKIRVNEIEPISTAGVGIGAPPSHASAILEMTSTTQGVLPPRMTQAQRDAIASPADGLFIYNTDAKRLENFNGLVWSGEQAKNIIVLSGPGTNLIGDTINGITDASVSNPYLIDVGPGVFTEAPITMKPYIRVQGSGSEQTVIQASNPSAHLITGCDFSALTDLALNGATTSGFSAVYHNSTSGTTNTAFWIENVRFQANDTLVKTVSTTGMTTIFLVDCKFGGIYSFNTGFFAFATSGVASRIVIRNSNTTAMTSPYPADVFLAEGVGSELVINSVQCRSGTTTTGNCIRLRDGANLRALALNVKGFGKALWVENVGAAVEAHSTAMLCDNNTMDIQIDQATATGCINACVEEAKVSKVFAAPVAMELLDKTTGSLLQSGALKLQQQGDGFVDVTTLFTESATMGPLEGGELSAGAGFTVNVADGFGYLETEPEIFTKVMWGNTSITLSPNQERYLIFDNTSTLSAVSTLPDTHLIILLGRVVTNSTSIELIDASAVNAEHTSNRFDKFFRKALGPVYERGSIVTENGTRKLDVTSGSYYLSMNNFLPSGGTAITWTRYFKNGSGGYNQASQSTVDNAFYDDGTGVLHALTASYYAKHTLYVVGDGVNEKYLLVYSQNEYSTLLLAEQAAIATPPSYFIEGVVPIASIVVQQGATNIVEILDERPRIGFSATAAAAATFHDELAGRNLDSNHLQYLLISGTRAMTGSLDMGTHNVTNAGTYNGVTVATALVGDITTIQPDDAASAGTANTLARGDHKHAIVADVAVDIATTNAEGVSTSFSRADHTHKGVRSVKANTGTQRFGDLSLKQGNGITVVDDGSGNFTIDTTFGPNELVVTQGAGLVANYTAGKVRINGTTYSISASSLTVVTGATNGRIYVDVDGVVKSTTATSTPPNGIPLAIFSSSGIAITALSDNRTFLNPNITFGGSSDIVTIVPNASAASGATNKYADAGHTHAIATASASSISTSTTNTQGTATSFARSDHTHAVTVTSSQATATADDTTASLSDVLINGMTLTPASGTYFVMFSTSTVNSGNGAERNFFSIYSGGSQVAASEVRTGAAGGAAEAVATQAIVTVNGSQAIEARWRVAGGTGTAHQRILSLLKLS